MGITLDMATTTSAGGGPFYVKYTASGSHLLQIDGYSITKHAPNGTSLKSCPFTVGGYRWMLHLFPNGDRPESSGFISIFICLYKCFERRRVSLQVELSFIDEVDKQNRAHVRTRQVLDLYGNYGVGYRRFIAREALENSKHLKGDRLTLRCDFIIKGYADIPENCPSDSYRKCGACNLRPVRVRGMPRSSTRVSATPATTLATTTRQRSSALGAMGPMKADTCYHSQPVLVEVWKKRKSI